ncbi:MAG: hypothetical protein EPO08_03555 [Rhodospirillaceae bacterium]|nr:MAG: hypothetical protein EPO08_03555 [Rhodospirillaceae bacterium]
MPKSATVDLTPKQFTAWCRRNQFTQCGTIFSFRFFDQLTGLTHHGVTVSRFPWGKLHRRLTTKHLLSERAAHDEAGALQHLAAARGVVTGKIDRVQRTDGPNDFFVVNGQRVDADGAPLVAGMANTL